MAMTMPSLRSWLKAGKRALTEEPCETFAGGVTEERKGEKMPPGDFLAMSILAPGHFVYCFYCSYCIYCARCRYQSPIYSHFSLLDETIMVTIMLTQLTLNIDYYDNDAALDFLNKLEYCDH